MIERFTAEKTADGKYLLRAAQTGEHFAFWSLYPNGFCDDNEVGAFTDEIVFDDPAPNERIYFHIMSGSSYSVSAVRLGVIPRMENLRDLGGYETTDGRAFVKYGCFYRSDKLCNMEEEDYITFKKLGIRQIVDFRVPNELSGREDPVFEGVDYLNISPINPESKCFYYTFADLLAGSTENAEISAKDLVQQYRTMAFGSQAYRALFARIAEGKMPILFHCSAGKDRTGVAAALILLLLGAPRETIIHDYLLTQTASAKSIEFAFGKLSGLTEQHPELREYFEMFLSVRRQSIESTLDEIERRYPNTDDFFVHELNLTKEQLENIRNQYLTKHLEEG